MAKAKEVLRRLVRLADSGKLSDDRINAILNGMHVNGTHEYRDGHLKDLKDGKVMTLSPDRINTVLWPADVKPAVAKVKRPAPKPLRKKEPDAGIGGASQE